MLYVFHVDTGTMMTFDMKLAMESVANLQHAIAREYPIPEEKQVLLISGGESLDPVSTVGKYHAGTDTNPIFLFSKTTIESLHPPSPSVHYGSDVDIQSQVEGSLLMPPAYGTVVSRAQLSLQIHEVDHEELKACEQLVHDQHLQQQGWAAVVANLEDITSALRHRSEIFTESYNEYLEPRDDYLKVLSSVEHSLQLLAKIPVLPCLITQSSTELYDKSSSSSSSGSSTSSKSLFDWISSQDPSHSLHDMVVKCIKATEQLDDRVLNTLTKEVQEMFTQVDNPSMKEVKGIEDRLYGLDQILSSGKRVVQEQGDMAQGFVQNQNRVSALKDKSILPDLCSSHKKQLLVMVNNHKKIQETKKKCKMAKEELAINLHARLRWVMLVEKRICDIDGKLIIYHENLKRLRKRLEVLKQIHDAPNIYACLVVEVVRRRRFSSTFTEWASSVAEESTQIHSEEYKRREAFISQVGRHFLQTLFTGLDPFSSNFAVEPPAAIDQELPAITEDDIEMLKHSVPELSELLVVPKESHKIMKSHWGVLTCTTNKPQTPKPSSLATSEIEIIHSYDDRFYTADHTELSLGDQVASSELTSNLLTKSDIGVTSPTERTEFIMPKSLSEELTKEMQETSRKKLLEESNMASGSKKTREVHRTVVPSGTGEVSGTSTSSGEQIKSTESESSSCAPDRSTSSSHSGKKKSGVPCTSPDLGTSQEFTTADFYIEDSMPSSMGGSPSSANIEDKSEKQLEDKIEEPELSVYKTKLALTETKLKNLRDFVSNCFPDLKQRFKDFETSINCDRSKFSEDLEKTKEKVIEILHIFDIQQQNISKSNVEKLGQNHSEETNKLQQEITELKNKNSEIGQLLVEAKQSSLMEKEGIQQRSDGLHKTIQEMKGQLELAKSTEHKLQSDVQSLTETLESHDSEFKSKQKETEIKYMEMEAKYKQELTEMSQQNSLEMEVELDKVRSDLKDQMDQLETEAKAHEEETQKLQNDLLLAEKERMKLEETLATQYQTEKDSIKLILTEEFTEKLTKEKEQFSQNMNEFTEKLEKAHEIKMIELKDQLVKNSAEEINKIQEEMKETFDTSLTDLKENYDNEKMTLAEQHKKKIVELEDLHSIDLMKLNEEFNKCKLELEEQLRFYTDKELREEEVQTNPVDKVDCAIVTDVLSSRSVALQTEPTMLNSLTESQCQTEFTAISIKTQTESTLKPGETQTESRKLIPGSTQTDLREVIQVEMQTDSWVGVLGVSSTEVEEKSVQTEIMECVQSDCQTERQETCDQECQIMDDTQSKKIAEIQEEHQMEINKLVSKLEKDKEESCMSMKTSLIAERQVSFNEAVNKVSSGKDSIILELREKDASSTEKLRVAQETIDKLIEEKSKVEDIKTRAMAHLSDKEREFTASKRSLEDDVAMLKQQLVQYQQQIQSMSLSSAPSVMEISTLEEIESKSKISMLEEEVKLKEEEISRMEQKLSEITMTASTRSVVQDKVSITSCSTGDLALFCLDERHDQYVVFTIGSTLHFLHSDCIEPLGLQANPSENRKSWVLAEITDKEYCQAKKSQNRFKVPIGTKFYRVKAKPWARDSSPRKGDLLPGTLSPRKGDSASASSSPRKGDPASGSS
ncbi:RB1-inducible coiled-coil protein 1-like [Mytilus edulis]|uniref:RB1-inducible coiled-coil protein 1-like n=1 Tax=Mytilus edulis TaxID=6550 RepID=UPI0039F0CD2C